MIINLLSDFSAQLSSVQLYGSMSTPLCEQERRFGAMAGDLRILVSKLEVKVLADFLQDLTADLLEVNLSLFSFPEAT